MTIRPDFPGNSPAELHLPALRRSKSPILEPKFHRSDARQPSPKRETSANLENRFALRPPAVWVGCARIAGIVAVRCAVVTGGIRVFGLSGRHNNVTEKAARGTR